MHIQIIKIEPARLDPAIMQVTVKYWPNKWQQLIGKGPSIQVYKGQNRDWYRVDCFSPAEPKVAKFLTTVYRGSEFRHLQYQYRKQIKKAS